MLALGKRINSVLSNPMKQLQAIMPELRLLRDNLKRSADSKDPLSEIVIFFNYVSLWHDRGLGAEIQAFKDVNYGQFDGVISQLNVLNLHFSNAGRCYNGWNRTEKGQTVTADHVYLGNIFGLFTKTVAFWKEGKDEKKGGWGFSGMDHLNPYDVVSNQALTFMKGHIEPMITIINKLEVLSR